MFIKTTPLALAVTLILTVSLSPTKMSETFTVMFVGFLNTVKLAVAEFDR